MSRIELQSFDLFRRIEQIHRQPTAAPDNLQAKYILLHKVLEQACYELTTGVTLSFANLFSRLDYICKEKKMTPSDRYAIQTMRRNCNAALSDRFQADMQEYLYDLRALVRFVSLGFEEDIPASILPEIPHSNRPYQGTRLSHIPYVRASVTSWNDTQIFAATDSDTDPFIIINYAKGGYQGDLLYLKDLLTENLPLNLLDVRVDEENHYIPNLIVIHPDYLIDISSLAACFREYGHHPLNYFMNKIKPKAYTAPILMGNLASQFLDDYINEQPQEPVTYPRTIQKFFAASALDFCTCQIPADFHAQAQAQMMNIRSFVHDVLPRNIRHFNKKNTLLEASFICEKLGLQGRVDMMQKDFQVLIEQKAGKRDEYNHRHKEDHFIQMMLYQGVLRYNFGQETEHMQTFLLYSKYADGLLLEHFAENLFRESIKLRNYIVHNEMRLGEGAIGEVVDSLSTDLLNELQVSGKLWNDYQEPQLQTAINTLKRCTPLERAYFNRFFTFVAKEQILSKTGGSSDASYGFAGNWHIPLHEKLEAGNILLGLTILQKQSSGPGKGYDLIELHIPTQEEDFLPNFRTGDMVILYSYQGEPDLRKHILMKGNILELHPDRMTLVLRNGQQNKDIIGGGDDLFAIEHDFSDTSANNGFRALYAFLSARADRKELLLGVRTPELKEEEVTLNGEYGRFNELIRKEKQAKDYFLLVGPPGTGKTSCALRYMVEEALSDPDTSILLLSYTNRAVDEICGMLLDSGIAEKTPFIRIGSELSCDKRFVPYLLKHSLADCPKLTDIRQKIDRTRIFVSTTTSLNSRLNLFTLKHFQLALIDEASQILEPDLIGILSARHQPHNAIDKFILVGDYKQLPAIAQQSAEEAAVTDPLLRQIGLEDCRNSLFERLYKSSPDTCRSVLRQQGRMHPAIAEFPNQTFYYREQLECVPLPHQLEETPYAARLAAQDPIDRLLLERRMIFIPAEVPESLSGSDKTNPHEARIVATLLAHIYRLTESHFDPNRTVGVIVPYRNQIAMIRKEIARLQLPALLDISIDTVERYQGSQRDVIIYSFTVQNFSQLNFLTANTFQEGTFLIDRKLNVALTRARKQLLLTGNPHILGANITFYKLLEYIRLHNGYLETDAESFCQGNFTLPSYRRTWELEEGSYSLPAHFQQAFEQLVPPPQDWEANETHYREVTAYGRCDFRTLPEEITPQTFCQVYNYFYLRKQYAAAQALFTGSGNWLYDLIRKVSGRVVFCDLSCEAGASGLAFADVCRSLPHLDLTYVDIYPLQEMGEIAEAFFQTSAYKHIQTSSYPRLSAIKPTFWQAHSVLTELVIFNLSSLFDRISPQEARDLALQINQLVHARPLNHYVLVYRDDAEPCRNNHSYTAFCNHLSPELKPLQPQMPLCGKVHCNPTEGLPLSQEFLYEIRTN